MGIDIVIVMGMGMGMGKGKGKGKGKGNESHLLMTVTPHWMRGPCLLQLKA